MSGKPSSSSLTPEEQEELKKRAQQQTNLTNPGSIGPKEEPKEVGVITRLKGLAKTYFGAIGFKAYVGLTAATGGWFAGGVALAGVGATVIGFGIKKLGAAFGWKTLERSGAELQKHGMRLIAAPAYIIGFAVDGIGNMVTGRDMKPGCVGYLDAVTSRMSGVDALKQRDGIGQVDKSVPSQDQGIDNDELKRQKQLEAEREAQREAAERSSSQNTNGQKASAPPLEENKAREFAAPQYAPSPSSNETALNRNSHSAPDQIVRGSDILESMERSPTYEAAKRIYTEKSKPENAFVMASEPTVNPDGSTTIIWKPRGSNNPDSFVTLTYDKDKNVTKHEAGKSATAILPPIKFDKGFRVAQYENGALTRNAEVNSIERSVQPIKSALEQASSIPSSGSGVTMYASSRSAQNQGNSGVSLK